MKNNKQIFRQFSLAVTNLQFSICKIIQKTRRRSEFITIIKKDKKEIVLNHLVSQRMSLETKESIAKLSMMKLTAAGKSSFSTVCLLFFGICILQKRSTSCHFCSGVRTLSEASIFSDER
jgi:hypothetical protein